MSSKFWVEEIPTGSGEDVGHDETLVEPKIQETTWPANAEPSGEAGQRSRRRPQKPANAEPEWTEPANAEPPGEEGR